MPHATCHMPHATCHMPHATCHMPHATCHMTTSNRQQKSETVGESKKTKQLTPFGFSQIPSHAVSSD